MANKSVAIVYATRGGMGDVGKFAAALAHKDPSISERVVAMTAASDAIQTDENNSNTDSSGTGVAQLDVTDQSLVQQVVTDFADMSVSHINIDDHANSTPESLETALRGVDAVVACMGSRQSGFGRWATRGGSMLVDAMRKTEVNRLVVLSSMGIGQDFMPRSGIRLLWGAMLWSVFRAVRKDLEGLEATVRESGLDYLIVRPTGLAPEEAPTGEWKLLTEIGDNKKDGALKITVAKSDVAKFMLGEAVNPTLRQTAVTIGHKVKS